MRLKPNLKLAFIAVLVTTVMPLYSQVAPAASQGGVPLVVGGGFSDFSIDWGPGQRMEGVSAWADWYLKRLPASLNGLGIEAEGRDIDFGRPAAIPRMRQDTGIGGPIYTWNRYRNFRPYAKYLFGIGSIEFPPVGTYSQDTFLVLSPGGGVEYHAWGHIWIRGDYEYQFWHHTFGPTDLTPTGFTIGASYDFRPWMPEQR
jgi:Outer membrane protein beta-barrel domain